MSTSKIRIDGQFHLNSALLFGWFPPCLVLFPSTHFHHHFALVGPKILELTGPTVQNQSGDWFLLFLSFFYNAADGLKQMCGRATDRQNSFFQDLQRRNFTLVSAWEGQTELNRCERLVHIINSTFVELIESKSRGESRQLLYFACMVMHSHCMHIVCLEERWTSQLSTNGFRAQSCTDWLRRLCWSKTCASYPGFGISCSAPVFSYERTQQSQNEPWWEKDETRWCHTIGSHCIHETARAASTAGCLVWVTLARCWEYESLLLEKGERFA